jgi:hypothetical protein
MARKIVLKYIGGSKFKISQQVKPGEADDYGITLPEPIGSWMVDETVTRTTSLGSTTTVCLIDYTAIPYKD